MRSRSVVASVQAKLPPQLAILLQIVTQNRRMSLIDQRSDLVRFLCYRTQRATEYREADGKFSIFTISDTPLGDEDDASFSVLDFAFAPVVTPIGYDQALSMP